jgi:large repetitive protein
MFNLTLKPRLVAAGLVVAAIMVAPAGASAFSNGDPCPPYWTEATAPTASFGSAPADPATQVSVSFDASASSSGTAFKWTWSGGDAACEAGATAQTDPISVYKWNFGDGSTETDASPTTSHTYASAGTYTVTLTVQEENARSVGATTTYFTNTTSHQVTITDRPPVASFTESASVSTGQVANFDASGSSDPDGTITKYHWDFGDGQTLDTTTPATAHIYSTAGVKTVTLTVTDNDGSTSQAQHSYTVLNRPPVAAFTAPATAIAGNAVSFDASASADPDGSIVSYHWVFGDGQTRDTTTPTTSYTYASAGTRTVTLTVTDNDGATSQVQHTINVQPAKSNNGDSTTSGSSGAKCVVPNLHGDRLAKARQALSRDHCRLGKIKHRHTRKHNRGRVVSQSARPGRKLSAGSAIGVTLGK